MFSSRIVALEQAKSQPRTDPVSAAAYKGEVRQNDPVDSFLSGFSPASQAWLRQHKDMVVSDGSGMKLSPKVMAAHYQAEANNLRADTPEYFQFVEQQLAPAVVTDDDELEIEPQTPAAVAATPIRRAAPVSAPVSRETPSSSGNVP